MHRVLDKEERRDIMEENKETKKRFSGFKISSRFLWNENQEEMQDHPEPWQGVADGEDEDEEGESSVTTHVCMYEGEHNGSNAIAWEWMVGESFMPRQERAWDHVHAGIAELMVVLDEELEPSGLRLL